MSNAALPPKAQLGQHWGPHCPVEITGNSPRVTLAHGDGGNLTRKLVNDRIIKRLGNVYLNALDDAARLPRPDGPIAMSTDSFVVSPIFYPGGDIGSLAVHGTVNDLAVAAADPIWLTCSLILEEGLPFDILDKVLESIAQAARNCGVVVVAGDTKVVPKGHADGLFINTAGLGVLNPPTPPGPAGLSAGDEIIVSGPVGQHGLAILAAREELKFDPPPRSDSQSLIRCIAALRKTLGTRVKAMRDATRGGAAAVFHEWAAIAKVSILLERDRFPMTGELRGVTELLGIDPIHLACEGTFVVAVEQGSCEAALAALREFPETKLACRVGEVQAQQRFPVVARWGGGVLQPLDEPTCALLPRIC